MDKNGSETPVIFSDEELKDVLDIMAKCPVAKKSLTLDKEKCDAIFIFIKRVIKKIYRKRISNMFVSGCKNIHLEERGNNLEFKVVFKNREIAKYLLGKIRIDAIKREKDIMFITIPKEI